MKVKQDDGTEIEVFTQEELDAKVKEVSEAADAKIAEKDTAVANMQKEVEDAKKALEDAGKDGKDNPNYKALKAALDEKDKKLTDFKTELDTVKNQRVEDIKNSVLDRVAGKDEDLRKKIEHHFNTTLKGVVANTPEEIKAKLENARKLSVEIDTPSPLDNLGSGGPGVGGQKEGQSVEFSSKEKALGTKLGISDDDRKKYAEDPRLKGMLKN